MLLTLPPILSVDLFCGAGGTSTGILIAGQRLQRRVNLVAVNHWKTAINTHSLNHPCVKHLCENVEIIHPRTVVPGGRLHLLAASCECTFHCNARGGGPCNEQSRAQAWQLIRWATDLQVDCILMENVREFQQWGPLHPRTKRPIKSRKGEFFRSFVLTLQNLGYTVEYKVQVAADFGDPTSRPRLMLIARKGKPVVWPEPTHGPGRSQPWATARQIIDFSIEGKDILKKDGTPRHCANTMKRIEEGFRRQGSIAEPFLILLRGTSDFHIKNSHQSLDEPIGSLTTSGRHHCLVEPFLVQTDHQSANSSGYVRSLDQQVPSIVTKQNLLLVQPMIAKYYRTGICKPLDEPLDSVTTKARFLLVSPEVGEHSIGVRTRLLQPHELAAAHSFPKEYVFTGNKADQTKQIGNSVPVLLAAAHAEAALSQI